MCGEGPCSLQPSPDLTWVTPRDFAPHRVDPAHCYLPCARQSEGSDSPFLLLCRLQPHNSGHDMARHGEWVARGPARRHHCPWVVEKEAQMKAASCPGTTCPAFPSSFCFQHRVGFLLEGFVSDPCHVLGDLLVISGSFLKLPLIYSSPCPFHLPRPSKGS